MHKSKKKLKSDKLPKPIKIKKEKTEEDRSLYSMSHYVDERLELIKQIFGTLKPKTIVNLAPEFLKKKKLEKIEEICLNELVCISTKRLLSIINGTKCPTDTESSEDSDVEHKEEHISLEEISSDSEIECAGGRQVTQRKKKLTPKDKKETKTNEKNEPEGAISVLELLELQARARAIRSQLALEPVTKIEVNSDEEKSSTKDKAETKHRKRKSNDKERPSTAKVTQAQETVKITQTKTATQTNGSAGENQNEKEAVPSKRIKLKRNYRKPDSENPAAEVTVQTVKEEPVQKPRSRSASPDVIPIQPETETLLISDSSDDEKTTKNPKSNNMAAATNEVALSKASEPKVAHYSEPEEGEVSDNDAKEDTIKVEQNGADNVEATTENAVAATPASEAIESTEVVQKEAESSKDVEDPPTNPSPTPIDEDDNNDDIISIEGGDLETEMSEHLTKSELSGDENKTDDSADDVISLNTSEDERAKLDAAAAEDESWHARYLKSSKVSQVLAASRLGKRVRDKIKNSKSTTKKQDLEKEEAANEQKSRLSYTSKHEDGSVEQYKELLELRQNKKS